MMRRTATGFMAAAMVWGAGLAVGEQAASVTAVTAQPTRVAMFKNGVGVVESRIDRPARAGVYELSPAPEALYGSFWLTWDGGPGLILKDVKLTGAGAGEGLPMGCASSLAEVLGMCVGRRVELLIDKQWVEAEILSVGAGATPVGPREIPLERAGSTRPNIYSWPGRVLTLRDDQGVRVLPVQQVEQVRFKDEGGDTSMKPGFGQSVLRFDVQKVPSKAEPREMSVALHYLARGIAWSPSYLVDVSDAEQARFSANVVVVNDLMDLKDVDIELVAGYPNLPYAGVSSMLSPFPLDALLAQVRETGRGESSDLMSNSVMLQQRAGGYAGREMQVWSMPEPLQPATPGEQAEDLYYYKLGKITLERGERGYYPLIDAHVPYEHLYTWDVPDLIDRESYQDKLAEQPQIVWHAVKLTNFTEQPWTTAAALVVADGRLLGQGMVAYTPTGGTTELKVTQALNVKATMQEREISRQRNAASFYGHPYDLVTIEGELEMTNFKAEPVTVRVSKLLTGSVPNKPDQAEMVQLPVGLRGVNGRARLTWRVEVAPGGKQAMKLIYRYDVYVRV
ncbi:MAG: hypothetical protein IT442_12290 [Phycisphaeraceae bacterium]|nr:hypothetical protein [Phycisphaeraceae bacterium]